MVNRIMYALFLGLFLLKEEVPQFVLNYVKTHKPNPRTQELWIVLTVLRNAPDLDDVVLYPMVKASL